MLSTGHAARKEADPEKSQVPNGWNDDYLFLFPGTKQAAYRQVGAEPARYQKPDYAVVDFSLRQVFTLVAPGGVTLKPTVPKPRASK